MGTLMVTNPQTGAHIQTLKLTQLEEILELADKASEAQKKWKRKSLFQRSQVLYRFLDLYRSQVEDFAKTMSMEMGKTKTESMQEASKTAENIKGILERANHLYGQVLPDNDPDSQRDLVFTRREPLGVVGCIIPFNYPVELTMWKVIPALIMGNGVIVKAPSSNPLAVLKIGELLKAAGLPDGLAPFLVSNRTDCTEGIIKNPKINALALTGSTAAGIQMAKDSAPQLKPLFLELGGNDPFIICQDADVQQAADQIVSSRICNAGQTCCAPKRFLVQRSILDELTDAIIKRLKKVKTGPAWADETELAVLVTEQAAAGVESQVMQASEEGASILYGGKRSGAFFEPTVLGNVTREMSIAKDMEIFGPVFPIIPFDTIEEAIEIANQSSYALNAGILSGDVIRGFHIASQIEAGSVAVNGSGLFRHMDQAHGGPKMSGIGREGISCLLEEYSQVKNYIVRGVLPEEIM